VGVIFFFLFLVAAIAGGAYVWKRISGPCGCAEGK
jgi:hypothetical protein